MFASALWFRLLLSLAMILNGSVAVGAAMPAMAPTSGAAAASSASSNSLHCHDDMAMASPHEKIAVPVINDVPPDRHATPDCCKSGMCQCACVHAAATLDMTTTRLPTVAHAALTVFTDHGVITHGLTRLDRPPIG